MTKFKLNLVIVSLLIIENIAIWYLAIFYYQYYAQQQLTNSRKGQAEVCKSIQLSESLQLVLKKMDKYPASVYVNSSNQIIFYYRSELEGFVTAAGVGFTFDEQGKLISKSCDFLQDSE